MSYSFNVRGATKAEVSEKVEAELTKVVVSQPVHTADRDQAEAAVNSMVGLLRDDDAQDISVTVSGSCWVVEGGLNSVGLNISASLAAKQSA